MSGEAAPARPLRAFVAIDLDEAARGRLAAAMDALRSHVPGLHWVRPETLHVTLRFLGWTREETLDRLTPLLRAEAARAPRAEVPLGPLGMFPERGSPRVLWVDVPLPAPLLALQEACEAAARACGFAPEARAFRSHLTLGRWKDRARRPVLPPLDLGTASLEVLVLFRSDLRPSGAIYTPLATFPLSPLPAGERAGVRAKQP